jgi:cytochrome c oxidase cbb3-type subunit I
MNGAVLPLVFFTFVIGLIGLLVLVRTITRRRVEWGPDGARVIFDAGEEGHVEEPAAASREEAARLARSISASEDDQRSASDVAARRLADQSSRAPVLAFVRSALFWLVAGSVLGLVVSLKMTFPDWLVEGAPLTFGRLRPLHLNTVIYGWASMAGIAVALWLAPRLARRPLVGGRWAVWGVRVWNTGMVLGTAALAHGVTDGVEWLEFPWQIDILFVVAGAMAGVPVLATLLKGRERHPYVSAWYLGAAFLCCPGSSRGSVTRPSTRQRSEQGSPSRARSSPRPRLSTAAPPSSPEHSARFAGGSSAWTRS